MIQYEQKFKQKKLLENFHLCHFYVLSKKTSLQKNTD